MLPTVFGQYLLTELGFLAGNIFERGPPANLTTHLKPFMSADFDEINTY